LGNASPFIETLATARTAAFEIFSIIDRKPPIDSFSKSGESLQNFNGNIQFNNIKFNYPSRNDIPILNDVSLDIKTGTTVALVGSSGCGKSTCIQLIQRFYDPLEGSIKLDGKDIQILNLNWVRSQIGVVNQVNNI
jgi:ATP-binding cassette, subfamily B (MDR/TAP), member 1